MANRIAKVVAHRTVGRWFDVRGGCRMMRSRGVPLGPKVAAWVIGVTLCAIALALEAPLEGMVAVLLPGFGGMLDLAIDGFEIILFPTLVACAVLPKLASPRS